MALGVIVVGSFELGCIVRVTMGIGINFVPKLLGSWFNFNLLIEFEAPFIQLEGAGVRACGGFWVVSIGAIVGFFIFHYRMCWCFGFAKKSHKH